MDKKVFATGLCAAALIISACRPKEDNSIRVNVVPKEVASSQPATLVVQNTNSGNNALPPGHPDISGTDALPAGHPSITGNTAPPSMAGPGSMGALPGMAEFTAATPAPKWSPAADWAAQTLTPTRKGSWLAPANAAKTDQAEISVTVFQGTLGGLLSNVNRWRGKVGLSADLPEARLGENVQNITLNGRPAQLISLDGPTGQSLEGVLVFMPDKTWSFLLSGPSPAVKAERANFHAFLDGLQWQD